MNIELALMDIDDIGTVKIYKKIEDKINNTLYITQYEREQTSKRLLHIGIKLKNINILEIESVLMGNEVKKIQLVYDKNTEYFYNNFDENEEDIVINRAGLFKVFVEDNRKKLIYESDPILIKPSIISESMYKSMIDMLLNINRDLVMDLNSSVYLKGVNNEADLSKKILDLIIDLEYPLKQINKNPAVSLIKQEAKLNYCKIKKLNKKILLEKELYPFKNKFNSFVSVESKDTYENRSLYYFLMNMQKCINTTISNINKSLERTKKEERNILDTLQVNNRNVLFGDNYKRSLENKKDKISYNIKKLLHGKSNYDKALSKINEYINFDIFNIYKNTRIENTPLKLTQVFLHDEWYRRCYTKIKLFYEDNNFELNNLEDEELNLKEVYDIFEIWSYFTMIKIMVKEQGWIIENKNIIRNVNKYIKKNGSLYGFIVSLKHKIKSKSSFNDELTLDIVYNKTLALDNRNLRPDFTFIITCRNEKKIFYLDAKYHNYLEKNSLFEKDIKETAFEKYYNSLKFTEYEPSGSYILHCIDDPRYINFGYDTSIRHCGGSFALTPENSSYFITWISMLMEWFFDEYDMCWNCGSTDIDIEEKSTYSNKKKYNYTCRSCGSFWVKNHCTCNPSNKLIKHDLPEKQYHRQSGEKWMVYCPICGECGTINKTDQENTDFRRVCDRCGGNGYIAKYKHVEGGICFKCNGQGYL